MKSRIFLVLAGGLASALCGAVAGPALAQDAPPVAVAATGDARLKAIYDAEWQWRLREFAQITDGLRSKDDGHFARVTPADWARRLG
jgi:hypothetical protein